MAKKVKYLFFIFLSISLFTSCEQGDFHFEEVEKVNNQWDSSDFKTFNFPIENKDNEYSLFFIVRNNNDYAYSNIYFFTKLKSPKGEVIADTLEYQLAYPDGKWIGHGMGDIKQNTLVYKEKIALQDTGVYQVSIVQAMRENQLKGIEDISLMIEKN